MDSRHLLVVVQRSERELSCCTRWQEWTLRLLGSATKQVKGVILLYKQGKGVTLLHKQEKGVTLLHKQGKGVTLLYKVATVDMLTRMTRCLSYCAFSSRAGYGMFIRSLSQTNTSCEASRATGWKLTASVPPPDLSCTTRHATWPHMAECVIGLVTEAVCDSPLAPSRIIVTIMQPLC